MIDVSFLSMTTLDVIVMIMVVFVHHNVKQECAAA